MGEFGAMKGYIGDDCELGAETKAPSLPAHSIAIQGLG
jgi:hypothetical protein